MEHPVMLNHRVRVLREAAGPDLACCLFWQSADAV